MTEQILNALKHLGIDNWVINEKHTQSSELFMIRHREDMLRGTDTEETAVTVYRDFDADGKSMRGSSRVMLYPGSTAEEITQKLSQAYANALNAANPYFDLPDPTVETKPKVNCLPLSRMLLDMRQALVTADQNAESYVNSSEIFITLTNSRTLTSKGSDVSYEQLRVDGEFIVQCKHPNDVEMYFDFDYSKPDTAALYELVTKALTLVRDRASADQVPQSGVYDVILCDEHVGQLMEIYLEKCDASMVYPGYSQYKVGTKLHEAEISGEKLSIEVFSSTPFSEDGIPMPSRPLIKEGEVQGIYGATRYCRYLGLEPTGSYDCIRVENGTVSLDDLKKRRVLMPLAFSDFESDSFRGSFGGEIRLAYLFENGKVTILTGGSVNGSLSKKQDELIFSTERYENSHYSGPKAVLIPSVSVAGLDAGH